MSSAVRHHIVHTTANNVQIGVREGKKSSYDFVVEYKEPGRRTRTPKHIHWAVDLLLKKQSSPVLTSEFTAHMLYVAENVSPAISFPPATQFFNPALVAKFAGLAGLGEYSPEFLLVVIELLMIQEKTNYPNGTMNRNLLKKLKAPDSTIFEVVSAATFRG